jgi:Fic family protein
MAQSDSDRLSHVFTHANPVDHKGRYLHWDEMRHRTPPGDLTLDEWWLGTAFSRKAFARPLPLYGTNDMPFRFSNVDLVQEMVHRIDQQAGGRIGTDDAVTAIQSRDRYLVSSLVVEEAITSSLLEGAATTRRVAREMLQSRRTPRDHGERMVLNNFNAMLAAEFLASDDTPLTPDEVLGLHRIVTHDTLDDEADAGRLQQPGEERVMVIGDDDKVLHRPPPAEELPMRMEALCAFANGELDEGFLHPVVRAILIHFWMGHDHPFVDGNGRTARALFYWSMLRAGYWLAQYFSISTILRKAPGQYVRSYLKAETDNNDATYFVIYQLEVIERAISSLNQYITKKTVEVAEVEQLALSVPGLNRRQLAVINAAQRDPYRTFTIDEHMSQEQVTYQSARTDLLKLEELGLLTKARVGKRYEFRSSGNLPAQLRTLAKLQT